MNSLLDRFCRYVKVHTTSNEKSEAYPSSAGQIVLGEMLVEELRALKLDKVSQNENGIVTATIPGNMPGASTIAWLAHLDTSPETDGENVKPVIHRGYDGKDIVLPGDKSKVIRVEETEGLAELKDRTIITSDGKTLLGADDKAGVAVIVTSAAHLVTHPNIKHGPIRIVFTCDEEIGRGVDKLDLEEINACVAYTLDGGAKGAIENETFSADLATVTIEGYNIHPGLAAGKMVNSVRLAGQFISRMPWHRLAPETAGKREGFLHPYVIEGGVAEVKIRILLRSFVTGELAEQAGILREIASTLLAEHPRAKIDVHVKTQYRNMVEALEKEPRAVEFAVEAVKRVGLEPKLKSVRGGTDGSRLSEMGLPTPNLFVGMYNLHSPLEFACLEEMGLSVKVLVELAQLWGLEERG